jgi:hypothetical protein
MPNLPAPRSELRGPSRSHLDITLGMVVIGLPPGMMNIRPGISAFGHGAKGNNAIPGSGYDGTYAIGSYVSKQEVMQSSQSWLHDGGGAKILWLHCAAREIAELTQLLSMLTMPFALIQQLTRAAFSAGWQLAATPIRRATC